MRKAIFVLVVVQAVLLASPCALAPAAEPSAHLALVPLPLEVTCAPGEFVLKPDTAIVVDKDSAEGMNVGKQLAARLRSSTGWELKVAASDAAKQPGAILITSRKADASLGCEGYRLEVTPNGVEITGGGAPGMLYGTQTFLQLLPPCVYSPTKVPDLVTETVLQFVPPSVNATKVKERATWSAPCVSIKDQPRFPWRGLLLDVARHFFTVEELKNFLDLMAQHKLNTLQIHFTDDVGWRIEIKRYPKLTEVAAWRKSIGFGLNPKDSTAYGKDGLYGGFYTQEEIRELVAYAQARNITIVPEIEMPGHAGGALSVYPEFSCFGGPYNRDGGGMGICCPGNDATFPFLENILSEVIAMFPSKYIHIGGDEVDKATWKKCPKCQARIKQQGLKNEHELQSYFVKRIEKFINSQGRTLIGWDEILEGGLAPNATVMSWRNVEAGVIAAGAGHDVVMTPTSHCYLDYLQAKTGEPKGIGGFLPLKQVYSFEPLPPGVPADKARHILGAGGNLWSEFFPNYAHVQYMAYPRACAIAELTWTTPKQKSWDDFRRRLETQFERLKAQGVKYRAPKKGDPGYDGAGK